MVASLCLRVELVSTEQKAKITVREALARSDVNAYRRSSAPARGRRPNAAASRKSRKDIKLSALHFLGRGMSGILSRIALVFLLLINALLAVAQRWPLAVFGGLLGTGLATAIIVNAVKLQDGEHPSPIFANGRLQTAIVPAAKSRSLPPPRPQQITSVSVPAIPAKTAETSKDPLAEKSQAEINDPIAHLIANGTPPAGQSQPVKNDIFQVQQALVKLGYAIIPDGLSGPATQQAISAFEKLEALPVTGDPRNAAMRKALAIASGMAL